jgi:NTP pyrophosphatase (non-canonical NTP hydrolase)
MTDQALTPDDIPAPAMAAILAERERQTTRWGVQRHSWPEWLTILTEEVGEAATAANEAHWKSGFDGEDRLTPLREELVQVAAVAVAMIEHIDELTRSPLQEGRSEP